MIKYYSLGGLNVDVYDLTVLEVGSLTLRCQQAWLLRGALRENLFYASPRASGGLLAIFVVSWLVDISLRSLPSWSCSCGVLPACMCVAMSRFALSYKDPVIVDYSPP